MDMNVEGRKCKRRIHWVILYDRNGLETLYVTFFSFKQQMNERMNECESFPIEMFIYTNSKKVFHAESKKVFRKTFTC